jgi:hypothetical protein
MGTRAGEEEFNIQRGSRPASGVENLPKERICGMWFYLAPTRYFLRLAAIKNLHYAYGC